MNQGTGYNTGSGTGTGQSVGEKIKQHIPGVHTRLPFVVAVRTLLQYHVCCICFYYLRTAKEGIDILP